MPWYLGVLLTVFVPLVVINTYAGWKLTTAISERFGFRRRRTAASMSLLLLTLNSMPLVAYATFAISGRPGMDVFSGESQLVDVILVYPFWATLVVMVQLSLLYLIWDLVRIVAVRIFHAPRERWRVADRTITLGLAAIVVLYSLPTLYVQTRIPRVDEQRISIPERFRGLDGLRILHISDVQGDGRTDRERVAEFVLLANTLGADIVMNSGDFVTTGDAYISRTTEELGNLRATIGVYAAVGDHDIFTGNKQKVLDAVREVGHTMLEDTSVFIPYRGATIGLTFVTYTYRERPPADAIHSLLSLPDSVYRILLVHQPAMPLMEKATDAGYDLILAGHTHGGGVAFGVPGLGFLSPASFETRYVAGLFQEGSTFIHVTTGLGFTLAPVRFNAPIELSLLILDADS